MDIGDRSFNAFGRVVFRNINVVCRTANGLALSPPTSSKQGERAWNKKSFKMQHNIRPEGTDDDTPVASNWHTSVRLLQTGAPLRYSAQTVTQSQAGEAPLSRVMSPIMRFLLRELRALAVHCRRVPHAVFASCVSNHIRSAGVARRQHQAVGRGVGAAPHVNLAGGQAEVAGADGQVLERDGAARAVGADGARAAKQDRVVSAAR